MSEFTKVASVGEIPPGQSKMVEAGGKQIAVFNIAGTFYAIDNVCAHAGGPLNEGMLDGDKVECPWHGAQFDIKTGAALSAPAFDPVASFKVRVSGDNVEVEV